MTSGASSSASSGDEAAVTSGASSGDDTAATSGVSSGASSGDDITMTAGASGAVTVTAGASDAATMSFADAVACNAAAGTDDASDACDAALVAFFLIFFLRFLMFLLDDLEISSSECSESTAIVLSEQLLCCSERTAIGTHCGNSSFLRRIAVSSVSSFCSSFSAFRFFSSLSRSIVILILRSFSSSFRRLLASFTLS